MKNKWTEWKSKGDILNQWFLIYGEIVFHSCFGYIYKVLKNSMYRKKPLILNILRKSALALNFGWDPAWILAVLILIEICIFLLIRFATRVRNVFVFMLLVTILIPQISHSL